MKQVNGGNGMRIGLHDAENDHIRKKVFPNLALMKLSTHHKSLGDEVEMWNKEEKYVKLYKNLVKEE